MGLWEKERVIANSSSSSSNYVADTDGTMTDLSEWMQEDLNTGFQFPLGTLGPTHSLVQCPPTGVHIIVMIDLSCEHVTDTLFVTYGCTKIKILFLISYRWTKKLLQTR
jgi:hypothetical protein